MAMAKSQVQCKLSTNEKPRLLDTNPLEGGGGPKVVFCDVATKSYPCSAGKFPGTLKKKLYAFSILGVNGCSKLRRQIKFYQK